MLAIVKPNKVRICIDPRDLNRAIRREHYQLPTIDEVASRLTGAKKFTLCNAKDGFHQILLDDASSYLTTFNTPFGRYRWARMPFGISSAPEVWQRRMHEFVEDLEGVEVIADDFLIAGFGETDAEVNLSLEKNERAFFKKCWEWNLMLNKLKLKRAQTEVRFMGHLLAPDGLKADPAKVEAILDMPPPTDVKGLKRFQRDRSRCSTDAKGSAHCLCLASSDRHRNPICSNRERTISHRVVNRQVQSVHTGTRSCAHRV